MINLERELAAALMSPTIMAALEALLRRVVREDLARQRTTDELVGVAQAAQLLSMTPAAVAWLAPGPRNNPVNERRTTHE